MSVLWFPFFLELTKRGGIGALAPGLAHLCWYRYGGSRGCLATLSKHCAGLVERFCSEDGGGLGGLGGTFAGGLQAAAAARGIGAAAPG